MQFDRKNHQLTCEIERQIAICDGTFKGIELKNMYENSSSYEAICDRFDIDYADYEE